MGSQQGASHTYNPPPPFQSLFPPSHRSVPLSFNLAAKTKESGGSCLFSRLLSPCLLTLPSLPLLHPCSFVFVLTFSLSPHTHPRSPTSPVCLTLRDEHSTPTQVMQVPVICVRSPHVVCFVWMRHFYAKKK